MASNHMISRGRFGRLNGIPVFVYHGLYRSEAAPLHRISARSRKYWISENRFRAHLQALSRRGSSVVSAARLAHAADQPAKSPVALTFDDGNASDYEIAYPLLLEFGVKAHFFVNTATVGMKGHLSWPRILEMRSHGMSFGSHGHQHCYLTHCEETELRRQLTISRDVLRNRLGEEVDLLAVPYGDFNRLVVRCAREAGYASLFTGRSWPARPECFTIDRTAVYGHTDADDFDKLLTLDTISYGRRAARDCAISIPKQIWLWLRYRAFGLSPIEAVA